MEYEIRWANEEKTAVIHKYFGAFETDVYYKAVDQNVEMVSSVSHSVDIILDMSELTQFYKGYLDSFNYSTPRRQPNENRVIVVGANSFIQTMVNTLKRLAPKASESLHFVSTLEDALKIAGVADSK